MLTRHEKARYTAARKVLQENQDQIAEQAEYGNRAAREVVRVGRYWAQDPNDTSQQRRLTRAVEGYQAGTHSD